MFLVANLTVTFLPAAFSTPTPTQTLTLTPVGQPKATDNMWACELGGSYPVGKFSPCHTRHPLTPATPATPALSPDPEDELWGYL